MRNTILKLSPRIQLALVMLVVLGLLLAVLALVSAFKTERPIGDRVAFENLYLRPDMTVTIPILFDVENTAATYDWALTADNEDSPETFVETTSFEIQGQAYEFLLATKKANPDDAEYTVPDYMALTLAVPNDANVTDTIVYIDLGADGALDSVFLNDEQITTPEALVEAQTQYSTEIVVARDHMLDSVSL
jgi:hypothetical protein